MDEKEIIASAEQLMSEKYGEDFTATDMRETGAGSWYVWLIPEKEPGVVVRAEVDEELTGISDNYPLKKICRNLTDTAENIMGSYTGECFIHTDNIYDYMTADSADMTAAEYLAENPGDRFDVSVFAERGADLDELYCEVVKLCKGIGTEPEWVNVYIIPEDSLQELQSEIERFDDKAEDGAQEIMDRGTRIFIETGGQIPSADEFKKELEK